MFMFNFEYVFLIYTGYCREIYKENFETFGSVQNKIRTKCSKI